MQLTIAVEHLYSPGLGGWGCIVSTPTETRTLSGGAAHTTDTLLFCQAVAAGVSSVPPGSVLTIIFDSGFNTVIRLFQNRWLEAPLQSLLSAAVATADITWSPVSPHAGALAQATDAARACTRTSVSDPAVIAWIRERPTTSATEIARLLQEPPWDLAQDTVATALRDSLALSPEESAIALGIDRADVRTAGEIALALRNGLHADPPSIAAAIAPWVSPVDLIQILGNSLRLLLPDLVGAVIRGTSWSPATFLQMVAGRNPPRYRWSIREIAQALWDPSGLALPLPVVAAALAQGGDVSVESICRIFTQDFALSASDIAEALSAPDGLGLSPSIIAQAMPSVTTQDSSRSTL